jgi:uncharacterized membrane protein (UPF0136 family)
MSTNYLTGALFAVLGGVVVVVSQAFTPSVLGWVAFGLAIAVAAVAVLAQLDRSRGLVQRALDTTTVIVAGLLIILSRTASGDAVTWLSFALGLGIVALAYAGLTVHEVAERREHIPAPAKADGSVIGAPQARVA